MKTAHSRETYLKAIEDLHKLRSQIGPYEFCQYGYDVQLREYRFLAKKALYSD